MFIKFCFKSEWVTIQLTHKITTWVTLFLNLPDFLREIEKRKVLKTEDFSVNEVYHCQRAIGSLQLAVRLADQLCDKVISRP